MKSHTKNLRFNHNPLNLILGTRKKQGLRIGYMEAALDGFYLNCMETGVHPEKLSKLLSDKFHCTDAISSCQLFLFLINEGDRASYSIMVPYLLSTENLNQFENTIRERFYGVDRFIQQGRNLYKFKEYIEERGEPIVWINDLERGVIGWDMAQVVGLARAAKDCGYITKEQAWEYIEQASTLCSEILRTPEEIDKSFLIGGAMKSNKINYNQMSTTDTIKTNETRYIHLYCEVPNDQIKEEATIIFKVLNQYDFQYTFLTEQHVMNNDTKSLGDILTLQQSQIALNNILKTDKVEPSNKGFFYSYIPTDHDDETFVILQVDIKNTSDISLDPNEYLYCEYLVDNQQIKSKIIIESENHKSLSQTDHIKSLETRTLYLAMPVKNNLLKQKGMIHLFVEGNTFEIQI